MPRIELRSSLARRDSGQCVDVGPHENGDSPRAAPAPARSSAGGRPLGAPVPRHDRRAAALGLPGGRSTPGEPRRAGDRRLRPRGRPRRRVPSPAVGRSRRRRGAGVPTSRRTGRRGRARGRRGRAVLRRPHPGAAGRGVGRRSLDGRGAGRTGVPRTWRDARRQPRPRADHGDDARARSAPRRLEGEPPAALHGAHVRVHSARGGVARLRPLHARRAPRARSAVRRAPRRAGPQPAGLRPPAPLARARALPGPRRVPRGRRTPVLERA